MEKLKLDRTKLITVTNYAKRYGVTRQTIYNKGKNKELEIIEIDGVKFVQLA